jgi:hypothetical protein
VGAGKVRVGKQALSPCRVRGAKPALRLTGL